MFKTQSSKFARIRVIRVIYSLRSKSSMFKTQSSKFAKIRVIRVISSALFVVDELTTKQVDKLIVAINHS